MDTLSTATELENVGFPTSQARAIVGAIVEGQELLAKKEDIERLEAKIVQLEAKMVTKEGLKSEMLKMELRFTKWFVGIIIANLVTAILVLVQLLS